MAENNKKLIRKAIKSNIKFAAEKADDIAYLFEDSEIAVMCINKVADSKTPRSMKTVFPAINLGYSEEFYKKGGAGPSSAISDVDFYLSSVFTLENVELTWGIFDSLSAGMSKFTKKLARDFSSNSQVASFEGPNSNDLSVLRRYFMPKGTVYLYVANGYSDINSVRTKEEVLISNMKKLNGNRSGDISIYFARDLGSGNEFIPAGEREIGSTLKVSDTCNKYFENLPDKIASNLTAKIKSNKSDFLKVMGEYVKCIEEAEYGSAKGRINVREYNLLTVYNKNKK